MIEVVRNADYVGQAVKRLPSQYRTKPRIVALVSIIAAELQLVEDALFGVLIARLLQFQNPTGDLLNKIGEIVGQERGSASDPQYLIFITARIAANRSAGDRGSILKILALLLPDQQVKIRRVPTGGVFIEPIGALELPAQLVAFSFLQPALSDGVRLYFCFTKLPDSQTLKWGSVHSSTNPTAAQSFGSAYNSGGSDGGQIAAVFSGADGEDQT